MEFETDLLRIIRKTKIEMSFQSQIRLNIKDIFLRILISYPVWGLFLRRLSWLQSLVQHTCNSCLLI